MCFCLSLSLSKICCIKNNRQTTKAELAGQQVHIHHYSHEAPLICCIFRGCFEVGVGGCLGVWALCHSYLDRPIPEIFVHSPNGLLLFDLAATLVHIRQDWASLAVSQLFWRRCSAQWSNSGYLKQMFISDKIKDAWDLWVDISRLFAMCQWMRMTTHLFITAKNA